MEPADVEMLNVENDEAESDFLTGTSVCPSIRPSVRPSVHSSCSHHFRMMPSNLYGYNDYTGPTIEDGGEKEAADKSENLNISHNADKDDDENDDPLRSGLWMEGDSLAPPCGTSVSTIHQILKLASVSSDDVVYDLGCGDGRVCLEALVQHKCQHCVGVEIESDLIDRFQELISKLPSNNIIESQHELNNHYDEQRNLTTPRICAVHSDLRDVLSKLIDQLAAKNSVEMTTTTTTNNSGSSSSSLSHLPLPTVIFLYLLPEAIAQLEPTLISLLRQIPKLRIVMNTWGLTSLLASQTFQVYEDGAIVSSTILLYDKRSLEKEKK